MLWRWFGEYVMGIHGKDGRYPTDGHMLGEEVPLGQGKVNYPAFVAKLKEIGYAGDITIEREISGEEQKKDIVMAKAVLDELRNKKEKTPPARLHGFRKIRNALLQKAVSFLFRFISAASLLPGASLLFPDKAGRYGTAGKSQCRL